MSNFCGRIEKLPVSVAVVLVEVSFVDILVSSMDGIDLSGKRISVVVHLTSQSGKRSVQEVLELVGDSLDRCFCKYTASFCVKIYCERIKVKSFVNIKGYC